jgi:serine/threonine protein kinase
VIGSQVLHYRVLRRLGAGAMGVVYAAEDLKLGRTVALKFLPDELSQDEKALARLTREAKAVSKLDHPNVGTLFALETIEERPFLVMGFYDGETLAQRLHRHPPLSVAEAQRIALEMARGLAHAHAQGVFHRDIKPGNVILAKQPDGSLVTKLLDFGLARLEQASMQLTRPGSTTGTPLYMAPEQVRGAVVNAQADIWAWGAVTYQMFSGHTPFEGPSIAALMMNIIQKEPAPLEAFKPDLPGALLEAVNGALKKPLEARWQSMGEVLGLLESGIGDRDSGFGTRGGQSARPVALEALTGSDWVSAGEVIDASEPRERDVKPKVAPRVALSTASGTASRPAWVLPLVGVIALGGVGAAVLAFLNANPAPPKCQPWTRSAETISLTSSGGLEWRRGGQTIFGKELPGALLEDCGAFAYGAVDDVKALYPGSSRASRQVVSLPRLVLTADRTEGVKKASLEFRQPLEALNNANTDGQEFYSADKRFVFAALEPTVPGVEYTWQGKTLNWSFYEYKLQPMQTFVNAYQTLEVDDGAELIYAVGLPDDGSVSGFVVAQGNEKTAVFFNFAGSSLQFEGVGVPPGIRRYLITNLRPGARYDLEFQPNRNWWSITLKSGGRYTVSSSGVLVLEAQAPS